MYFLYNKSKKDVKFWLLTQDPAIVPLGVNKSAASIYLFFSSLHVCLDPDPKQ